MSDAVPPGRSGRLWLLARLAAARRGADVLDRKRQLLAEELRRLSPRREAARQEFLNAWHEAERWGRRAELLGGTLEVQLVARQLEGRASLELALADTMGVAHPSGAVTTPASLPPLAAVASNGALAPAAAAYGRLVAAAASHAAFEAAGRSLERELDATTRRVRALERRRIPNLERSLRELELRLEEFEREERFSARWASRRAEKVVSPSARDSAADPSGAGSG